MANPVANPDFYHVITGDELSVGGGGDYGVLTNDTDPDDEYPLHTYAYGGPTQHGSYDLHQNGDFTYQSDPGFVGKDTFSYGVYDDSDDTPESSTGIVTVYVRPEDYEGPEITAPTSVLAPHGADKTISVAVATTDDDAHDPISVRLYVGSGDLTLGAHGGVTVTGNGTGGTPMTLSGSEDDINAALQHLSFTADGDGDNDYLEIYLDDALGGEAYQVVQIRDQQSTDVVEGTGNNASANAQNLDGVFQLFDDPDVDGDDPSAGGDAHVSVLGEGNNAVDWFSFTTDAAGNVIIDIDYGEAIFTPQGPSGDGYSPTAFDAIINLYQEVGGVLVPIDLPDSPGRDGADGFDAGSSDPMQHDPYVSVELAAGKYFIEVGQHDDSDDNLGDISGGNTYQLNITAPHAANAAPHAVDDAATIAELRTSVTVPAIAMGSVLDNDTDANSADVLSVSAVGGASGKVGHDVVGDFGTLVVDSDGSYSYSVLNTNKLIKGETGHDTFHYTVSDGHGGTDTATISFTVTGDDLDVFADGQFIAHRGDDRVKGDHHADHFAGRAGDDRLLGHGGDDKLWGQDGADHLVGGAGDDLGIGGKGADVLALGAGDDTGWGDDGDDAISGDDGADTLYGNAGNDAMDGGAGADRVQGREGNDDLFGGSGGDRMWGGTGEDALRGNGGSDRLVGGADNDTAFGGNGADKIWGDGGDDSLVGGGGHDQLVGGSGDDQLFLDAGNDDAWGGAGDDRFVFTKGFGDDHVKDFHDGDKIVFAGVFADWADVKSHMSNDGDNVFIDAGGGNVVTVEHVGGSLHQGDVLIA